MRGEPRCVRRTKPRCRFLPVAQVCPTAIPRSARHLRTTIYAGGVSDDRRARVLGASEGCVPSRAGTTCRPAGAWLSKRTPTSFPSSASKGHPLSPVRSHEQGRDPARTKTDRPRPRFHRLPAKGDGLGAAWMPSTITTAGGREDRSSSLPAPVSRSRRPHSFLAEECFFRALQALRAETATEL